MHYRVGDQPAERVVVEPADERGDPVDLDPYDAGSGQVTDPAGVVRVTEATLVHADDDEEARIEVALPLLDLPGVYRVDGRVTGPGGLVATFEGEPVVAEAVTHWHTLSSARLEWKGAVALDDVELWVLLEVSRLECAAYGRAIPAGDERWTSYRKAQLTHARNRNAAARTDPASGQGGTDGFDVGTFPLDWVVRQMMRPKRRVPVIR